MALPKINSAPKYDLTIPSTSEKVRFRPFLVKEEKILMMAMESNDTSQMLSAIVDTLDACIEEGVDRNKLTTFDVEYMFTQLRSKSVGETSTVGIKCTECEETNEVKIPLDSIKVDVPELEQYIEIDGDIKVEVKWPAYSDIIKMNPDTSNSTEQVFAILRASLAAVHTAEERIDLRDESDEEVQEFIESMNTEQFEKVRKHIEQMPSLSHEVTFTCSNCGHKNTQMLEGMQSFF